MTMSGKTYDVLKYIAQIVLPALATLVITVFSLCSIPYGEIVSGVIVAVDTFLGSLLKLSSDKYYSEEFDVAE